MSDTASDIQDLTGRVALVTGGTRGIGLAVATELLRRGAAVTVTGRKQPALDASAARLASIAGADRVLALAANTGDDAARATVIETMIDRFGAVDVLVNNTGINPVYGPLMDADLGAVRKTFDTNVAAALGYIQLAYHAHMAAHGGAVINIASVAGLRSTGVIPAYGASKAALIRLTEELAWELAPTIRVNAVAPGIVRTDFARVLVDGREDEAVAPYPMGRLGTPEDIARAVAFLAGDQAAWITGETLRVDGGLLATGTL